MRNKGFSMVEIMITIVIIGVCIVMALRAFSFCAKAVSEAYNTTYAVNILQEKINALREKAIIEEGITVSSCEEQIKAGGREFDFIEEIVLWENPTKSLEETEESVEIEQTEEALMLSLCEVTMEVRWGSANQKRNLIIKTLLPEKEAEVVL